MKTSLRRLMKRCANCCVRPENKERESIMNIDNNIEQDVLIFADNASLAGTLRMPPEAHGLIIFAHGSGSSRHSPRNKFVAQALSDAGFGTLLFDLLTPKEEQEE